MANRNLAPHLQSKSMQCYILYRCLPTKKTTDGKQGAPYIKLPMTETNKQEYQSGRFSRYVAAKSLVLFGIQQFAFLINSCPGCVCIQEADFIILHQHLPSNLVISINKVNLQPHKLKESQNLIAAFSNVITIWKPPQFTLNTTIT